jgi:hypothetical protein
MEKCNQCFVGKEKELTECVYEPFVMSSNREKLHENEL